MNKLNVLFLCTGNSARSQMAEAFLRKYGGDHFDVYSAGLEPKGINPLAQRVMDEIGVSLEGQWSKNVNEYLGKKPFAYFITVCSDADAKCPATFPGPKSERLRWFFEDPAAFAGSEAEALAKFREVRDQIRARILAWLTEMNLTPAKLEKEQT